jgi:fructan beta-fructosidase
MRKLLLLVFFIMFMVLSSFAQQLIKEPYRSQFHFTPAQFWMNDPNGMIFHNGTYHLFFQYFPGGTTWGPMHWGHAISKDMIRWEEQPIALYPDSLGYIFSGSAILDKNNSTGFGKDGKVPLVAIFTQHDPAGEKEHRTDYQVQSIAYSLDEGKSWVMYEGNPVLKNPGIVDFRDPKVMWYEPQKKWVMTLATKDRISFYSSPDLKNWIKESEFGAETGAHGGVWECPDLFELDNHGKKQWVLLVSINPGAPNGGSGTQYFIGNFDGKKFTPINTESRWMDYGPDNYAGVTFSNTGSRKILIGWMSNWLYGEKVPTEKWRSAMTIPRELKIKVDRNKPYLASEPVNEFAQLNSGSVVWKNASPGKFFDLTTKTKNKNGTFKLSISKLPLADFSIVLSNNTGDELIIGYDRKNNNYFIDRTKSGKTDFYSEFAKINLAPRVSTEKNININLIADVSSVEMFADDGLSVMTSLFFPTSIYTKLYIKSAGEIPAGNIQYNSIFAMVPEF